MRQQKIRTVWYGLETALYGAPQLWSLVPVDLKSLPNVNLIGSKIKQWECTECPCKLCKTYLKNIDYVGLSPSKKICIICFIESPLKIMKNAFYFI